MNLLRALALPVLLSAALSGAWNEREDAPSEGAARLDAVFRSNQVEIRFSGADSHAKPAVVFVSTNGPVRDLQNLCGAVPVGAVRSQDAKRLVWTPRGNGVHHFAFATYLENAGGVQSYRLVAGANPVTVTGLPEASPAPTLLRGPSTNARPVESTNRGGSAPTNGASAPMTSSDAALSNALTSNAPPTFDSTPIPPALVNEGASAATNVTAEAVRALAPPMQALVLLLSNYLEEKRNPSPSGVAVLRDEYFKAAVDPASEAEITELLREIRTLRGQAATLQQKGRAAEELEVHAALIRIWTAQAKVQKMLRRIADRGWPLSWWDRLQEDGGDLSRAGFALWKSLLNRYRTEP